MPPTLLERSARPTQLITTNPEQARALEDPIRIAMLELMAEEPRSIADLVRELRRRGFRKAPNTIRHHLELLKEAGLVELTKAEDVKGGVLKYYAARARFLGHYAPEDFDERFEGAIRLVGERLKDILKEVKGRYGGAIEEAAESIRPCPYCERKDFEDYILASIVNRALAKAMSEEVR